MVAKSARRTFRVSLFRELATAESPIRTTFDPVLERVTIGASDDYRREQGVNHRLSYASVGTPPGGLLDLLNSVLDLALARR